MSPESTASFSMGLLPEQISRRTTPKLKTSVFSVAFPYWTYSGAR
ncbi:unnamed protein product [Spirodela intermedia]|uniref:Uncharacterized protein n=1 Tax=Spirodela intermedia TaxID=51605 RepID=A0A7I8JLK7_SPIIN|nr:unnamed protein product [Spirodela intermedia]CAA6670695.1 unnamed protein product [Spirodela intermedia]